MSDSERHPSASDDHLVPKKRATSKILQQNTGGKMFPVKVETTKGVLPLEAKTHHRKEQHHKPCHKEGDTRYI